MSRSKALQSITHQKRSGVIKLFMARRLAAIIEVRVVMSCFLGTAEHPRLDEVLATNRAYFENVENGDHKAGSEYESNRL